MSPRLILALALSLALHGGLFLPDILKRLSVAPPPPALQATLRLPPMVPDVPFEPLLKNTIDTEEAPQVAEPQPPSPVTPQPKPKTAAKREVQVAQRKLSKHLFYPPEAVARGLEGEVRLILKLSADGSVDDVNIAASSGYPILDNAAIKAAYAMGKLTGATSRELILPVIFRLE
ncbi:TonB family protein [Propionivibrio sp.]|uniref:energy transducer TonB n=1 Tax=Propionivibrio sp. TaxID=2212460 RepID=UPI003BF5472C